ncbi:MAG TPA: polyamine ABC transporter substrate-binding protein [Candidatus Cybelea sp.]|nr:polyamine ABC transporter substrate-binding protein [Candidatus Cybelea sp.]
MTISGWALGVGVALALAPTAFGPADAAGRVVNVYNWSDYIDSQILKDFERDTGIKVVYDTYDSNEVLETKLLAGKTGYDVVVPTSYFLAREIRAGAIRALDKAKLPNLAHLSPAIMARMARFDPGNDHAVVYMWGTSGIGFNADMIGKRMQDAPTGSLRMVFDPAVAAKFADCGIMVLDAPDEIVPAALKYLGEDPDSKDPKTLAKAEAALLKVRPYIRKFHSSEYIEALANGDICLAFGWSGDVVQAKKRAEEAKRGVLIEYRIPQEGAQMWFDSFAMPNDAPHPAEALAFIDYMMRPDVIARASNFVFYPNANRDADDLVSAEVKSDPEIYPPPDTFARLYTISPYDQAAQRVLTRVWTHVKGAS